MKLMCKQFFRIFCCQVQGASITNAHEFLGIFQLLHLGLRHAFAQNHSRDIPYHFIHSFIHPSWFLLLHIPLPNTWSNHNSQTVWPSVWTIVVCSKPWGAQIFYFKVQSKQGSTPLGVLLFSPCTVKYWTSAYSTISAHPPVLHDYFQILSWNSSEL